MESARVHINLLRPNPRNSRAHPRFQIDALKRILIAFGQQTPMNVDRENIVRKGNGTLAALRELVAENHPKFADGIVNITYTDLQGDQLVAYANADNRMSELSFWDVEVLRDDLRRIESDAALTAVADLFKTREMAIALEGYDPYTPPPETEERDDEETDEDDDGDDGPGDRGESEHSNAEDRLEIVSRQGGIYRLGPHILFCGSSSEESSILKIQGHRKVGLVLTDPPYCSGGFQEAGRSKGSKGTTTKHRPIVNDTLSTRGFQALIRAVLGNVDARAVGLFTDWRMWTVLFDAVEASGYGVRSMVVWDKLHPGMGRGFRAQHEIIQVAIRDKDIFADQTKAHGNVISCPRTRNGWHETEKPVALLRDLLSPFPRDAFPVYDPFAGSGSTLIACHDRPAIGIEWEPYYCDVIRRRWGRYARINGLVPGPDDLPSLPEDADRND